MQRLRSLNEIYQKRLIRPEYAQHQATPYSVGIDATLFNTDGSFKIPLSGDTTPLSTRTAAAATLVGQSLNTAGAGSLLPGLVMVKTVGEFVGVATGVAGSSLAVAEQPFGLLANWVGGDFDDIGPQNVGAGTIGVWRGPDSTYTLLAPAFNDGGTGGAQSLSSLLSGATPGQALLLYAGADGRLCSFSSPGNRVPVARLLDRVSAARIVIELIV